MLELHQRLAKVQVELGKKADLGETDLEVFNPPPTPILRGLYLGKQSDAGVDNQKAHIWLEGQQVKLVITCSGTCVPDENKLNAIEYLVRETGDAPDSPSFEQHLTDVLHKIHEARSESKCVLIHCNAGASRSASYVVAYLIGLGLSFEEAYRHVKHQRLLVNVSNFEQALQKLTSGFLIFNPNLHP